jgi:XTP/dITP diphosphohydrolase
VAESLLLATRSADKAREIREILGGLGLQVLTLREENVPEDSAEDELESAPTFLGNARAKAAFFAERLRRPVLADDSGLVVDALQGAPGVRSKRFSSRPDLAGAELDRANNALLLQRLEGVQPELRTARYVCAAVLHFPTGAGRTPLAAIGTCEGLIATRPEGSGGFGYDPLFLIPELVTTFAALPPAEKHRRSHRGRAFRALAALLANRSL